MLLVALSAGNEGAPALDTHFRAVEEILHRAWPAYTEPPRVARDARTVEHAFRERRPRIVCCFGEHLDLDGRALAELLRVSWGAQPPQILLLSLVGDRLSQAAEALAGLHPEVPLIALQCSPDAAELQASALDWLHTLLEGGEDADPVCALHEFGVERAVVWGAYGRWRTRTAGEPPREKLAHLLLDRRLQRAMVRSALDELVHEGDRRLCCLLGYGAEGNLVDRLGAQLFEHLRRTAQDVAHVSRLTLSLPEGKQFDAGTVEAQVRRDLGLGPRTSLGEALRDRRPRIPHGKRPVLLLDWGVRGDARGALATGGVTAWLEFCAGPLCAECPPDLRLLSLLSIESASEKHDLIKALVNGLRGEPRFRDRAFRVELLEPLDRVWPNDLADFLDGRGNSSCPDDLLSVMPDLIVGDTGGHFERTLARIEEAERRGWYDLYDALRGREPVPAKVTVQEEGTL